MNFTISLDKELKKEINIQYIIYLDSVIFSNGEELFTWNIDSSLSGIKTCFLNIGETKKIYGNIEKNNCKERISKEFKKVVWGESGTVKFLSLENFNNGFINDPVSQKMKR